MQKLHSAKIVSGRRSLAWILVCLSIVASLYAYPGVRDKAECRQFLKNQPYRKDVQLNFPGQPLWAEKADTIPAREKGLSNRECIGKDQAMLFIFDADDTSDHCFWMKDMRFPIDMYWLDNDKRVVFSATDVQPSSYPNKYCPNMQTRYVIEMHGGVGKELLLDYNDIVPF